MQDFQNKGRIRLHFETTVRLISLFVFILTAFFSLGHHQSDEHYQVLEFCQYKLGLTSADMLPWEFSERIRSSLQPWIAFVFIKFCNSLNITNPFHITFLLRLLCGLFAWVVIGKLNSAVTAKIFFRSSL
ncbi:MAG: hypothetical protein HC867_02455 [Bacteroidia bacterium]|nr:hypothetical protein [Bacteroidia bacterium]